MLASANAAVDYELRLEALQDLCNRVDDWKNHRVDHFGDLLLHGQFPVVTGKSDVQKEVGPHSYSTIVNSAFRVIRAAVSPDKRKLRNLKPIGYVEKSVLLEITRRGSQSDFSIKIADQRHSSADSIPTAFMYGVLLNRIIFLELLDEHPKTGIPCLLRKYANEGGIICPYVEQYTIYLFERILLCCKELNPNKSKEKLMGTQKDKKDKKDKSKREANKNAKLQLKGRIFMTNVTEVISAAKVGMSFLYRSLSPKLTY